MTTTTPEIVIEDLKLEIEDARRNDVLYRLSFSWEVVQALIANVERLEAELAETRRAALLEACKATCPGCEDGDVVMYFDFGWKHIDKSGYVSDCEAGLIRKKLLAQEQERAQGEGGKNG